MSDNPYFRGVRAVNQYKLPSNNDLNSEDRNNSINNALIAFARNLTARKQQGGINNQKGLLNNLAQVAPSVLEGVQEYDNSNDAILKKMQDQAKEQWFADMQANQFNLSHANALNNAANQDRNYERQINRDNISDQQWNKNYERQILKDEEDKEYKNNYLDVMKQKAVGSQPIDKLALEKQKLELQNEFKTKGKTGDEILQEEAGELGVNQPKLSDLEKAHKLYFPKLTDSTKSKIQTSTLAVGTALPMIDEVIKDLDTLKGTSKLDSWVGGISGYTAPLKSKIANFSNDEELKKEAATYEKYQLNLQKLILLQETEFTKNRIGPQMYDRLSPYFPNKGDSIESLETKLGSMRDVLNKAALAYNLSEKYNAVITINDIDKLIKIVSKNEEKNKDITDKNLENDIELPDENDPDWQKIKENYGL